MVEVISFLLVWILSAGCLWAGMKLTRVEGSFVALLVIVLLCTGANLIPHVGLAASIILMVVLIVKWTSADFWPDAVLMVIVARLVSIGVYFTLAQLA